MIAIRGVASPAASSLLGRLSPVAKLVVALVWLIGLFSGGIGRPGWRRW